MTKLWSTTVLTASAEPSHGVLGHVERRHTGDRPQAGLRCGRVRNGGVKLAIGGEGDLGLHLAGVGVEHRTGSLTRARLAAAGDEMGTGARRRSLPQAVWLMIQAWAGSLRKIHFRSGPAMTFR